MKFKNIFSTVAALLLFCAMTVLTLSGCNSGDSGNGGNQKEPVVEYTVSYDSDGGSAVASEKVASGQKATVPASPVKSGYVFSGWYNGNDLWVFNENKVSADLTLKAKWVSAGASKVVTYDTDGGSIVSSAIIPSSGKIMPPVNPTKDGYTFVGWYNGQTPWVFLTSVATTDITLTAKWELTDYAITYELGEGAVNAEENPATYTMLDEKITLAAPTRDGFVFTGWTYGEMTSPKLNLAIAGGEIGDITVTANWEAAPEFATYKINYDLGGGVNAEANPATYTVGGELITLIAPTKANYRFIGWTSDDISIPTENLTIDPAVEIGDKSFTANWEVVTYTIDYVLLGGAHIGNPTSYTVNNLPLALKPATKAGFYFEGWYADPEFTVAANTLYKAENLTLYAKFTDSTDGLVYELNKAGDGYIVSGYTGTASQVYIAYAYNGLPIVEIADNAFNGATISSVLMPDTIVKIGAGAFGGCETLKSIKVSAGIEFIGADAFGGCDLSASYVLYDGVYYLGSESNPYAIAVKTASNTLTSVALHQDTKVVYSAAFAASPAISELILPEGLTMLCNSALSGLSKLTELSIPSSLKYLGKSVFSECTSLQYYIEGGVKYLGNEDNPYIILCKVDSSVKSIEIKAKTKVINSYAFYGTSDITVTYEDRMTELYINEKGNDILFVTPEAPEEE